MFWLRKAIDRGVEQGVNEAMREFTAPGGRFEQVVGEIFDKVMGLKLPDTAPLNQVQFTFAIAQALGKAGMRPAERCRQRAVTLLAEVLADEKIKFGDDTWTWDRHSARILAREYEIEHWDSPPQGGAS